MSFTIVSYKNKRKISAHKINTLLNCKRKIRDNIAREPVKDSFFHKLVHLKLFQAIIRLKDGLLSVQHTAFKLPI